MPKCKAKLKNKCDNYGSKIKVKVEESDGQFTGSSGNVYIINQDEWDELVQMNSEKEKI